MTILLTFYLQRIAINDLKCYWIIEILILLQISCIVHCTSFGHGFDTSSSFAVVLFGFVIIGRVTIKWCFFGIAQIKHKKQRNSLSWLKLVGRSYNKTDVSWLSIRHPIYSPSKSNVHLGFASVNIRFLGWINCDVS